MPADFALVALPGAYHSSVGALIDCFRLAQNRVEHVFAGPDRVRMETRLRILSIDGAPVPLGDGTLLPVDGAIGEDAPLAFIWLPAFRAVDRQAMQDRLAATQPLLEWLHHRRADGAVLGASGAAALMFIAAGLTGDMRVPVGRALQPLVRQLYPRQPIDDRAALADHDDILIGNGLAGDIALIIRVMERTISPDIARWLASVTGLESEDATLADDPLVARAQLWMEQRFTGSISMAALAGHLSTSPATLNRRFQKIVGVSPKAYVNQLRFQAAIRMLEKSARSIDVIAQMVGYSDSRLFRTMFRNQAGMTATQWREAHQERKRGTAP